jgi:UDP-GlcNAc:undecaprenyl-phosphate GlcNAc-1-phosphate transferase
MLPAFGLTPFSLGSVSILVWIGLFGVWFLAFLGSKVSYHLALKYQIVDDPKSDPKRKKQIKPIPLMGATGAVIVASSFTSLVWLSLKYDWFGLGTYLQTGLYQSFSLSWILLSVLILMVSGYLDDTAKISNKWRFILTFVAICLAIFPGQLKIEALSYPFDCFLPSVPFLPQILSFLWLGFCLFSTKVLDGHDGLVTLVGIFGFLQIASIATLSNVNQPLIFIFAIIWATSLLGYIPFNFPNARSYLGDGGSMVIGFMLGILSIVSGAKVATASTVIGWFIIDVWLVWILRYLDGRNPLTSADRLHWHFRLKDLGLSKIQVLVITMLALFFTSQAGLWLPTAIKIWVVFGQIVFIILAFFATYTLNRQNLTVNSNSRPKSQKIL